MLNDSVWLSQRQMSDLFDKNIRTINEHIQNVFSEGELVKSDSVVRNFRITAKDGKSYKVEHHNLDVIISVGYRVKSLRGTQFRIWATQVLTDHIIRGYSINRNRLPEISWDEFDRTVAMIKSASAKKLLPTAESMVW